LSAAIERFLILCLTPRERSVSYISGDALARVDGRQNCASGSGKALDR